MVNLGTKEGEWEERNFVKEFNKNKNLELFKEIPFDFNNTYAIHVISHKYGIINQKKIKPKADVFFAFGNVDEKYLINNDFYLDENDYKKFDLQYHINSGVSIKRNGSKKYQILKINPSTFYKLFDSYELGAGASIYCKNLNELEKNRNVIKGWKTSWNDFFEYFKIDFPNVEKIKNETDREETLLVARDIKSFSNKKIKSLIEDNKELKDFIFKGIGNFEEPFTAYWFYDGISLKKLEYIPYVITTGSGRSKGDFTIVIKPTNLV